MSSLRYFTEDEREALETVWALERQLRHAQENFEQVHRRETLRARLRVLPAVGSTITDGIHEDARAPNRRGPLESGTTPSKFQPL